MRVRRFRQSSSVHNSGFSVLEMLIVLAILGIVAVIFIPNFLAVMRQARLTGAAKQVMGLVQQTRARAIRDRDSYSVGVDGAVIAGRGILDSGLAGTNQVRLGFDELEVAIYPPGPADETSSADCLERYDGTGPFYDGDVVTFDSLGVASGTLAICLSDGRGNVMQVALDGPNDPPRIRKYLPAGVSPTSSQGWFENLSEPTAGTSWTWF